MMLPSEGEQIEEATRIWIDCATGPVRSDRARPTEQEVTLAPLAQAAIT